MPRWAFNSTVTSSLFIRNAETTLISTTGLGASCGSCNQDLLGQMRLGHQLFQMSRVSKFETYNTSFTTNTSDELWSTSKIHTLTNTRHLQTDGSELHTQKTILLVSCIRHSFGVSDSFFLHFNLLQQLLAETAVASTSPDNFISFIACFFMCKVGCSLVSSPQQQHRHKREEEKRRISAGDTNCF